MVELAQSGFIQVAMLLDPSFVTLDDIKEVKVPNSVLGAEIDPLSPPELLKQFEEFLAAKYEQVDSFGKIFPKVVHGWTMRYKIEDEEAVNKAGKAHQDMLEWFSKHVKLYKKVVSITKFSK